MEADERKRVGARVSRARRENGLTQAQLARELGVTTRSIQNYESGAVVPWRHLGHIERMTGKRAGWLLSHDETPGELYETISSLLGAMERHQGLLDEHLRELRQNTDRLREQREVRRGSRSGSGRAT